MEALDDALRVLFLVSLKFELIYLLEFVNYKFKILLPWNSREKFEDGLGEEMCFRRSGVCQLHEKSIEIDLV